MSRGYNEAVANRSEVRALLSRTRKKVAVLKRELEDMEKMNRAIAEYGHGREQEATRRRCGRR